MGRIQKYFPLFLYSNIFIGLGAVALTMASLIDFEHSIINPPLLILIFSSTVLVYSFHSIAEINSCGESNRELWLKANTQLLYSIIVISATTIFFCLFFLNTLTVFSLILLGILSYLYSKSIALGTFRIRLKENLYIKILVIAFVWAFSTVLIPYIEINGPDNLGSLLPSIVKRFLLIVALAIPFDIRDVNKDSRTHRETIATQLGTYNAKAIAFGALTCFALICLLFESSNLELFIIVPASIFLIGSSNSKGDYFYNFFGDGLLIVYAFLCCLII